MNILIEKGLASELIEKGSEGISNTSFESASIDVDYRLIEFDSNEELMKQVNSGLRTIITAVTKLQAVAAALLKLNLKEALKLAVKLPMNLRPQQMRITRQFEMKGIISAECRCFAGIAVNKENTRIAVGDCSFDCVHIFNMDGDLLLTYGSKGSKDGQLSNPQGLTFLNDRDLVISDSDNHRVCIVNSITGTLVKTFGKQGKWEGEFWYPCGVHVGEDLDIIVSENGNNRVQVFTKDGVYQNQIRSTKQHSINPDATILHKGLFYVSDSYNNVIHVFELKGKVPTRISTIGGKGSADGQLNEPCGLAIDSDHNLLVCDYGNNRIQKFTLGGSFVMKTSKEIQDLCDIAVLKDGQMLVTCNQSGVFYVNKI
jgi:DNA-binding beta-propeller fold protein YncE